MDTLGDLIRFLLRPDYDWVEDWQESREYAARARPALDRLASRLPADCGVIE